VLGDLHRMLFAPLEEALAASGSGRKIVIVPHGLLHQLPFHALYHGERYLVEDWQISIAPSAAVLGHCLERPLRAPRRALLIGVADPTIPAAEAEARMLARRFPEADLRLGERANRQALLTCPPVDVLHLATHGLFRADNPMFSALRLDDGWMTARDLSGLALEGTSVTLSACESGRSDVSGGDEVLGLTRALLQAGATSITASLWLVQDDTTPQLMDAYYRQRAEGLGPAAALRAAQLETMAVHSHPYYWAPFILVGRPE
jgi:CHAT domain-containing protein